MMITINNISFQLLTNMNITCFVILSVLMFAWSRICIYQINWGRYIWFAVFEIRQCYYIIVSIRMNTGTLWFSHHL